MLVVTEIAWNGGIRRLAVDTSRRSDASRWEDLVSRVPAQPPPYRVVPGAAVYHVGIDSHVLLVSENDLAGPLRDLVVAVLTAGTGQG
jgi:hypothetical protein